jgi:hypothetical protein
MFLNYLNHSEKKAFLELAHLIAISNGVIDEKEKELIQSYCLEMGLNHQEIKIEQLKFEEAVNVFEDLSSKKIAFAEAVALALTHEINDIEPPEVIRDMKEHFGFDDNYYEEIKSWVNKLNEAVIKGSKLLGI